MIRMLARTVISVLASAIALFIAAAVLPDFSINGLAFVTAVIIFAVVSFIAEAVIRQVGEKSAPVLLGSSSLIATLISLIITSIVSDGISITGTSTWLLATLIVWLGVLLARFLLPLFILKDILSNRRDRKG